MNNNAVVIGAGIVGLALARALSIKGYKVIVIEKNEKAVGASIRNFGMIWPIGQPSGALYNRAIRSKDIWREIIAATQLWNDSSGSLHLAYSFEESIVLEELYHIFLSEGRPVKLLYKEELLSRYPAIKSTDLISGLYSSEELIIDPRIAIPTVAAYLASFFNVQFHWNKMVTRIETGKVFSGNEVIETDLIFLCTGQDIELHYPSLFTSIPITKCKLQMMRFVSDVPNFQLGASVCGGLSLIHYNSFKAAPSLEKLKEKFIVDHSTYLHHGIHVMVCQNQLGELTVGDSHEYGLTHEPFDRSEINQLITKYLGQMINCENWKLIQTWQGVYPKMQDGSTFFFANPESGVYILNGLGGAGMTLSFGLAEECITKIF